MNQNSSAPPQLHAVKATQKTGALHNSPLGVWEVLIPVGVAALVFGLAVAAFLLGGK